jgi:hypothetical protein
MPEAPSPTRYLNVFAVLFALLGVSNLLKPFQIGGAQTGFVFFGHRLSGTANAVIGPLFGVYLLVYAYALWSRRRFAVPMAHAYATYVILNLTLFFLNAPQPEGIGYQIFGLFYAAIAVGVSLGAAIQVTKIKAELK